MEGIGREWTKHSLIKTIVLLLVFSSQTEGGTETSLVDPSVWADSQQGHPMNPSCTLQHPIKEQLGLGGSWRQRDSMFASRVFSGGHIHKVPFHPCRSHPATYTHLRGSLPWRSISGRTKRLWLSVFLSRESITAAYRLQAAICEEGGCHRFSGGTAALFPSLAHHWAFTLARVNQTP